MATADKNEYVDGDKKAIIPVGFTVSDKKGETSINGGLVVYAPDNSEYVWIPVDGILNEDGTIADVTGSEKKILLGRYEFTSDGIPSEYASTVFTEDTQESHNQDYINAAAKDIEEFIQSVSDNKGYYIARYEAGDGNATTDRADYSPDNNPVVVKSGQYVYNYVTQPQASELCQNLYSGVTSDLVNSYAWDTAILFIQKYGQKDYSMKYGYSINSSLQQTGLSGDVQLNIYDMAGNCSEWSTETCSFESSRAVFRGGNYAGDIYFTSGRDPDYSASDGSISYYSFRPLLYL